MLFVFCVHILDLLISIDFFTRLMYNDFATNPNNYHNENTITIGNRCMFAHIVFIVESMDL